MFQGLSNEFDFNIMYSERGQLTLAHTDATVRSFRQRAEVKWLDRCSRTIFASDESATLPSADRPDAHLGPLGNAAQSGDQTFPWYHLIHFNQEALSTGLLTFPGVFGIGEGQLCHRGDRCVHVRQVFHQKLGAFSEFPQVSRVPEV